jgi:hypothetical protein
MNLHKIPAFSAAQRADAVSVFTDFAVIAGKAILFFAYVLIRVKFDDIRCAIIADSIDHASMQH